MAPKNLTSDLFRRLSKFLVFCGIPNLWEEEMGYTKSSMIWLRLFWKIASICLYCVFVMMELISFFTQTNLTEKQSNDRFVFNFSHSLFIIYYLNIWHYKEKIKRLINTLAVELKGVYNDMDVEKQMIRKFKLYAVALTCSIYITLIFYGFDGLMQLVYGGKVSQNIALLICSLAL